MHIGLISTECDSLAQAIISPHVFEVSFHLITEPFLNSMGESHPDILVFEFMKAEDLINNIQPVIATRDKTAVPILVIIPGQVPSKYAEMLLRIGIDGCVYGAYDPEELLIRIRHLYAKRRSLLFRGSEYMEGDVSIDIKSHIVRLGGDEVCLTRSEYVILLHLLFNQHMVTNPSELAERCQITLGSVNTHIRNIRKKMKEGSLIRTVPRYGYVLEHTGTLR